jgi:hypothetical protein
MHSVSTCLVQPGAAPLEVTPFTGPTSASLETSPHLVMCACISFTQTSGMFYLHGPAASTRHVRWTVMRTN